MDDFGIFAKYWEPGRVKTRLAVDLGFAAASELYREFLVTLVRRFAKCADMRTLVYTPDESADEFMKLAGDCWSVEPQSQGCLGTRMTAFFDHRFEQNAERVVLIGSDSPSLPIKYVESAFRALHSSDVVLGPTDDGGYYLIGASQKVGGIFEAIDWSTDRVWEQTIARAEALSLSYETQPGWYDVDDGNDLKRLGIELAEVAAFDSNLNHLLQAINRII